MCFKIPNGHSNDNIQRPGCIYTHHLPLERGAGTAPAPPAHKPGKLRSKCLLLKTRGYILCAFHTPHPATPLRNGPFMYKAGSSHDSQARHSKSAGELHFRNTGDEHTDQGWTSFRCVWAELLSLKHHLSLLHHHCAPSWVSSEHNQKRLTTRSSPSVPPPAFLRPEAVRGLSHWPTLSTCLLPPRPIPPTPGQKS